MKRTQKASVAVKAATSFHPTILTPEPVAAMTTYRHVNPAFRAAATAVAAAATVAGPAAVKSVTKEFAKNNQQNKQTRGGVMGYSQLNRAYEQWDSVNSMTKAFQLLAGIC